MPAGKLQIPKKIKELQAPTKILRDELKLKLSDNKHSWKAFNEAYTGVCFMVACAVSEQVVFDRHNISKVEHLANTNRNRSHPSNGPARTHVLRVHHRQKWKSGSKHTYSDVSSRRQTNAFARQWKDFSSTWQTFLSKSTHVRSHTSLIHPTRTHVHHTTDMFTLLLLCPPPSHMHAPIPMCAYSTAFTSGLFIYGRTGALQGTPPSSARTRPQKS